MPGARKLSDNAGSFEPVDRATATMPLKLPELRDSHR